MRYLSFTGLDQYTDLNLVESITDFTSHIEFAYLYNGKQNSIRYPSFDFIKKLEDDYSMPLGVHICGDTELEKLFKEPEEYLDKYFPWYSTVQLNVGHWYNSKSLQELVDKFSSVLKYHEDITIKLQIEDLDHPVLPYLYNYSFDLTYDRSRGRGKQIGEIPDINVYEKIPYLGLVWFAGGLNPDNIVEIDQKVSNVRGLYGLDMESGIRTDDKLDLNKVQTIIDKLQQ